MRATRRFSSVLCRTGHPGRSAGSPDEAESGGGEALSDDITAGVQGGAAERGEDAGYRRQRESDPRTQGKTENRKEKKKEKMTYRLESLERINTRSCPCLRTQAFFRNKNPISACERRLKTMEQLCQKLPENDATQKALPETRDSVSEVKGEVERAHVRLQENPDKWSEWHRR